jgi:predicted ATPase
MYLGLDELEATGAAIGRPRYLGVIAEAHGSVGQFQEGFARLTEAFTIPDTTNERFYEAELYRMKGELFVQSRVQPPASSVKKNVTCNTQRTKQKETRDWRSANGLPASLASSLKPQVPDQGEREAEACFLKAIEVARGQEARLLELRATMSLSRLWKGQGKTKQAKHMLTAIYDWFTEGFDK